MRLSQIERAIEEHDKRIKELESKIGTEKPKPEKASQIKVPSSLVEPVKPVVVLDEEVVTASAPPGDSNAPQLSRLPVEPPIKPVGIKTEVQRKELKESKFQHTEIKQKEKEVKND